MEISRNASCPCGSGKKYKHCCIGGPIRGSRKKRVALIVVAYLATVGAGVAVGLLSEIKSGVSVAMIGAAIITGVFVLRNPPKSKGRTGADRIDFGR